MDVIAGEIFTIRAPGYGTVGIFVCSVGGELDGGACLCCICRFDEEVSVVYVGFPFFIGGDVPASEFVSAAAEAIDGGRFYGGGSCVEFCFFTCSGIDLEIFADTVFEDIAIPEGAAIGSPVGIDGGFEDGVLCQAVQYGGSLIALEYLGMRGLPVCGYLGLQGYAGE